jgi:hypothetical protein
MSAIGQFLPLYVVYKGLHLYDTWCFGGPQDVRFTCSPSGWMETDQFCEWFEKIFIQNTAHLEGPKLLIFDGHSSHINTKVVDLALANNIELFCLPAHTSSILQPLDVGVFKGVKNSWRKCLRAYYDESRCSNVEKRTFPTILKRLVDSGAFSRTNAVSGFEECGIYPLNRAKITDDKLATSVPLDTRNCRSSETPECTVVASTQLPLGSLPNVIEDNDASCATMAVSLPCASSGEPTLTPRKGIEKAILSHLRQITPIGASEKKHA